jgi:hypothetical protein
VTNRGLEQAYAIEPDPNETRTLGNELTVVQQLLGNLGRFNTPNDGFSDAGSAARR